MAFSLQKFKSGGTRTSGSTSKHVYQFAEMYIVATVNDVSIDISNFAGTFWTAALADASYGKLALAAQAVLTSIQNIAVDLKDVESEQLLGRLQAAAPAGTSFTLSVTSHLPTITCAAGNGATLWIIKMEWAIKDTYEAVVSTLGAAF